MKKSFLYVALALSLIIGFVIWKVDLKLVMYHVKGLIFKDRINQMFKENQILIDQVLAICKNTDGENKIVDKSDQIPLDDDLWITNYWNIVFDEESESFKFNDAWKDKIMDQLRPIKAEYHKLKNTYKNIIDQKSQSGSGIDEKSIGYRLKELWGEVFWSIGSSLADDSNDYRRKKKALVMTTIASYFPYGELEDYLRDRILLAAIESGEFQKHFQQAEAEISRTTE